jgi:GT2 family glycosyltransferase
MVPESRSQALHTVSVTGNSAVEIAACLRAQVIFIRLSSNAGYAAGNNAGITLALQLGADYVWILNNDTLVEPSAAQHLVEYMQHNSRIGLCGTTIMSYEAPDEIRVMGGWHYNKWTAKPLPVLSYPDGPLRMSYIDGASVCVSRDFITRVGLLCEEYFLFCEELDWAVRAQGHFDLGYCEAAVVYHKGMASYRDMPQSSSEYYGMRARLAVTRKFWPRLMLTVWPSMLLRALIRIARGQPDAARAILRAAFGRDCKNGPIHGTAAATTSEPQLSRESFMS